MPKCHQCDADTGTNGRNGDCKICYSKGVDLCQKCAMWELGPLAADVDLAASLRKARAQVEVERQERDKSSQALNRIGDEPLACDLFFKTMEDVCPFFKDQLTNTKAKLYKKQFKTYTCDVLDKFRDLYKTCKYDRLALQVLIAFHLSSQERVQCRDKADGDGASTSDAARPVKRWQTRTIAKAHLSNHLDQVQAAFGKTIRDTVARPAWLLALGCDDLELFLKGFKHPTLVAIDLLAAAGSAAVAREALEVFLIVYHALTATRPRSDVKTHWSSTEASFCPKEALGFLSERHFVALYGDVETGAAFSDAAKARIESLWNVLGDNAAKNALPAHPRFADGTVSGNGALDAVEKAYLQYLPTFDHPHAQRSSRTACETAVRTRVVTTLKKYLADYGPAEWFRAPDIVVTWRAVPETKGRTKTLVLEDPQRNDVAPINIVFGPSGIHASSTLETAERNKIGPFVKDLLAHLDRRANPRVIEVQISGEEGNERRAARRKAVEDAVKQAFSSEQAPAAFSWRKDFVDDLGAFKDSAPAETLLDELIAAMKADFCVDQAFDAFVSKLIVNNAIANKTFAPLAWFPLKTKDVPFTQLFPQCNFGLVDLPTIDEHYAAVGGTSPRGPHYMDWRNHKDLWLYDGFAIDVRRRPLFGSLSTQPFLPPPNSNYGGHILYYNRPQTNNRAVYTFGDKQQPRRSMLLLLDTILHGRKKKDGDAAQSPSTRRRVLHEILRRHDVITFYPGFSAKKLWDMTFQKKKARYWDGDSLIECQIFGGVTLTTDAWGFVPAHEDPKSPRFIDSDLLKTKVLESAMGQLAAVYNNLTVLPYTATALAATTAGDSGPDDWKKHLSEIAE